MNIFKSLREYPDGTKAGEAIFREDDEGTIVTYPILGGLTFALRVWESNLKSYLYASLDDDRERYYLDPKDLLKLPKIKQALELDYRFRKKELKTYLQFILGD